MCRRPRCRPVAAGRIAVLMIAGVAAAEELPLYTVDPGDFKGLEDLLTVVAVSRPG